MVYLLPEVHCLWPLIFSILQGNGIVIVTVRLYKKTLRSLTFNLFSLVICYITWTFMRKINKQGNHCLTLDIFYLDKMLFECYQFGFQTYFSWTITDIKTTNKIISAKQFFSNFLIKILICLIFLLIYRKWEHQVRWSFGLLHVMLKFKLCSLEIQMYNITPKFSQRI